MFATPSASGGATLSSLTDGKSTAPLSPNASSPKAQAAPPSASFWKTCFTPAFAAGCKKLREQFAAEGKPAVVLDAPLLLEAGWGPLCDFVLMVDVPRETRLTRATISGWTDAEFARREAAQWPVDEKRRLADAVIANDGTEAELRDAVRDFWQRNIMPNSRPDEL